MAVDALLFGLSKVLKEAERNRRGQEDLRQKLKLAGFRPRPQARFGPEHEGGLAGFLKNFLSPDNMDIEGEFLAPERIQRFGTGGTGEITSTLFGDKVTQEPRTPAKPLQRVEINGKQHTFDPGTGKIAPIEGAPSEPTRYGTFEHGGWRWYYDPAHPTQAQKLEQVGQEGGTPKGLQLKEIEGRQYNYDPGSGTLTLAGGAPRPTPDALDLSDATTLERIRQSVPGILEGVASLDIPDAEKKALTANLNRLQAQLVERVAAVTRSAGGIADTDLDAAEAGILGDEGSAQTGRLSKLIGDIAAQIEKIKGPEGTVLQEELRDVTGLSIGI